MLKELQKQPQLRLSVLIVFIIFCNPSTILARSFYSDNSIQKRDYQNEIEAW